MTKDESKILDWRSTGRRKARRALFAARVPFKCVDCGKTTKERPKEIPSWFDELWPEENRVLSPNALQADHESKDYQDNDLDRINWRCSHCHKLADQKTEKGVSQNENQIRNML